MDSRTRSIFLLKPSLRGFDISCLLKVSVCNQPWRWVVGALTSQLSFPSGRLCHILIVK